MKTYPSKNILGKKLTLPKVVIDWHIRRQNIDDWSNLQSVLFLNFPPIRIG